MDKIKLIEKVEKYWDDRPCNVRHSNKELGTPEYFEEVEMKKYFVEPHILDFTEFPRWKDKNVLEIGCGLGTAGINFVKSGANYTGVELSTKTLQLAKKRFEVNNKLGLFYHGNAEDLTSFIPIKVFDLVYSFGVIHHTPNPEKIISELINYMNPDSILKIMVYAKQSWKNYMIEAEFDRPEAQYGCPIVKTYTKDEIKELLSDFEILSIEQDHIFPYKIDPYKNGEYEKQPWFESMPFLMFKTLEKKLGWHLLITARLKK